MSLCKNFVGHEKFVEFFGDNLIQCEIGKVVAGFFCFSVVLIFLTLFISAITNCEGLFTSHNNREAIALDFSKFETYLL